jgi:hypothetical protein
LGGVASKKVADDFTNADADKIEEKALAKEAKIKSQKSEQVAERKDIAEHKAAEKETEQ